jgi:hypothetical protein
MALAWTVADTKFHARLTSSSCTLPQQTSLLQYFLLTFLLTDYDHRYSPPQSPIASNIASLRLLHSTLSTAARSASSSDHPKLAALSAVCSLIPIRAPTITAPTYGKSSTQRVATFEMLMVLLLSLCFCAIFDSVERSSWKRVQSPHAWITPWY